MLPSLRRAVAAALVAGAAVGVLAVPQASPASGARACNNAPSLCGLKYNQLTHMGAHDSAFLRDASTKNSLAGNQFKNATVALDAGIRLLQAQVHRLGNTLELCHSRCKLLDAGPLAQWLAAISDWMARNPNEVLTLILVNEANGTNAEFAGAFEQSGIASFAYKAPSVAATTNWPTLDSMISQGGRLVSFVTDIDLDPSFPYLLNEFNHIFETPFEVTELTGFNCTVDRPKTAGSAPAARANGYMSLVNHFKYQPFGAGLLNDLIKVVSSETKILEPDVGSINVVNNPGNTADGNLGKHLDECSFVFGAQPNFVLVDFFNRGNPIDAADRLNRLSSTTGRKSVSSSDSAGSALATGRNLASSSALLALLTVALLLL